MEVFTICPLNVPAAKFPAATELLARINWNLRLGNFDIDLGNGEIRFRSGARVGDSGIEQRILGAFFFGNSFAMDRFFPAIASVVYGNSSPEKAIAALRSTRRISGEREEPSE